MKEYGKSEVNLTVVINTNYVQPNKIMLRILFAHSMHSSDDYIVVVISTDY